MTSPMLSASFYKRPLPDSCVPFASTRGKELFAGALQEGGMEAYFPLSSQVRTVEGSQETRKLTLRVSLSSSRRTNPPSAPWEPSA